jgi:hypothetical protein
MNHACQMHGELNTNHEKMNLIVYNQCVKCFLTLIGGGAQKKAEIRANAGFRFVANQKNHTEDEIGPIVAVERQNFMCLK